MFKELFYQWQAENKNNDMRGGSKMSWARQFAEWLDKKELVIMEADEEDFINPYLLSSDELERTEKIINMR